LIGPVVIGSGADIEASSHLEKTIVMEHTRITQPCFLEEKLVGKSFCIDVEGSVLDQRHSDTSWQFNDARSQAIRLNEDQAWLMGSKAELGSLTAA
jgi:ADP-glucose pyrophosphorylase